MVSPVIRQRQVQAEELVKVKAERNNAKHRFEKVSEELQEMKLKRSVSLESARIEAERIIFEAKKEAEAVTNNSKSEVITSTSHPFPSLVCPFPFLFPACHAGTCVLDENKKKHDSIAFAVGRGQSRESWK